MTAAEVCVAAGTAGEGDGGAASTAVWNVTNAAAASNTASVRREVRKTKPRRCQAAQRSFGQAVVPKIFVPLCALCVFVAVFSNKPLIRYRPKPKSSALKKSGTMSTPPIRMAAISM